MPAELTADNSKGGVQFEGGTSEAKNREREPFPFAAVATQGAGGCRLGLAHHSTRDVSTRISTGRWLGESTPETTPSRKA